MAELLITVLCRLSAQGVDRYQEGERFAELVGAAVPFVFQTVGRVRYDHVEHWRGPVEEIDPPDHMAADPDQRKVAGDHDEPVLLQYPRYMALARGGFPYDQASTESGLEPAQVRDQGVEGVGGSHTPIEPGRGCGTRLAVRLGFLSAAHRFPRYPRPEHASGSLC